MDNMDRIYYKAMIAIITILMTVCTFFIVGIFKKADLTYEYVIGHEPKYTQLRKEVDKINLNLKENPKLVQNNKP